MEKLSAANGSRELLHSNTLKHLRTAAGSEDSKRETSRIALYIQAIVRPTTLLSKQP
jgi:hypothetical protein